MLRVRFSVHMASAHKQIHLRRTCRALWSLITATLHDPLINLIWHAIVSLFFPVVNSPASFIRSAFSACRPLTRGCRPEKVGDRAAPGQQRFEHPAPRSRDEKAMGPECVFFFFFYGLLLLNHLKQLKSSSKDAILWLANEKYVWKRNNF